MSGVGFTCVTGEVSLVATTAKTVIGLLAGANHRVHIKAIKLGFKGTAVANEPVTVEYVLWTVDGTGTAGTIQNRNADDNETPEASFKYNYSAEPTTPTVLESFPLHPQGVWGESLPIEAPIPVPGSDYWGIRLTADDNVNAMVTLICDE